MLIGPIHDLRLGHGLLPCCEQPFNLQWRHLDHRNLDRCQDANGKAETARSVCILRAARNLDENQCWLVLPQEDVQGSEQLPPPGKVLAGLAHLAVLATALGRDELHGVGAEDPPVLKASVVVDEVSGHHAEIGEGWV